MKLPRLLRFLLLVAPLLHAGAPIYLGEVLKVPSRILQEERTILVSLPANYARTTERYPVLYLTDGDTHFTHVKGTVDFLVGNGLMPKVIIVGITNTHRTRDLTPTEIERRLPGGDLQPNPNSGGGPKFLEFFEKELFPYVESAYRTAPYRIFAGHSFGGLLVLHALAVRPELFQAYLAASPSLQWDNDYAYRKLQERFEGRADLAKILFVTMGDEERNAPLPHRFDRLQRLLKGNHAKGFRWGAKAMPDEDHGSVVLRSYYWGLRYVFEGWRMDRDVVPDLPEIKAHFARLSDRMGYPIQPPEVEINQAGYRLLGAGRSREAIEVFRHNVELYPASANVHDSLGEALEQAKRLDEALASYARAVDSAQKHGDPLLATFVAHRDRLIEAQKGKR